MPRLDNLRVSRTCIDSQPFLITDEDGRRLFVGRIRPLFDAEKTGVQIVQIATYPGVKLTPSNGFLDYVPQNVDHDDGPERA